MRIGLREMKAFSKLLFPSVKDTTFFESCGVADLITTCCKMIKKNVLFPYWGSGFIYNEKTICSYRMTVKFWQWEEGTGKLQKLLPRMRGKGFALA